MIVHSRIEGTQLAGNLLGDPTERDLFVYLPPGYEESKIRYPTAYLCMRSVLGQHLAGGSGPPSRRLRFVNHPHR